MNRNKLYGELRDKIKDVVDFMKIHGMDSAEISLEDIAGMTTCNVKYKKEDDVKDEFLYFYTKSENEVTQNSDEIAVEEGDANTNDDNMDFEESNSKGVPENISEELSSCAEVENKVEDELDTSKCSEDNIEKDLVKDDCKTINEAINESMSKEASIDSKDTKDDKIYNGKKDNEYDNGKEEFNNHEENVDNSCIEKDRTEIDSNKDSNKSTSSKEFNKINFKEENLFQKETIRRILSEEI